jgi:UDP-2,4-diacetamido-2,4,6-trideoxy-beta-L-altropyranose hydrolase
MGDFIKGLLCDHKLRQDLGMTAGRLVDGRGCERIAVRMGLPFLTVRPAGRTDGELMHAWRNAPETRSVSRDSVEISLADHLDWLDRSLSNPSRFILMGEIGGLPIGVVRFDQIDADHSEVSIYLDPALHGLGLGVALLLAGERKLASQLDDSIILVADTLPDNKGSQALFQRAGYEGRTSFAKALPVHRDSHV